MLGKSVIFPYISKEQFTKEVKIIPFTMPSKRIKYLGINLTGRYDLHIENYEMFVK